MGRRRLIAGAALVSAGLAACGADDTVTPLPRAICSPIITAAGASPDLLVVADMPRRGRAGDAGIAASEAVRLTLARKGLRAGEHRLGFQACDDSTSSAGSYDQERCAKNGRAYASNPAVVGVIGPMQTLCAARLIPGASRRGLAVVSPSATGTSLTMIGAGVSPAQFAEIHPTGRQTFFRVAPPDAEQARVAVALFRREGAKRLFAAREPTDYGASLEAALRTEAARAGIEVLPTAVWSLVGKSARELARRARAAGADGAHLSGVWQNGGAQTAAALRSELGPAVPIVGSDGFVLGLPPEVSREAEGMWVTVPGLTPARLPPAGKEIVREVGTGPPPTLGSPYAAAATELLLDAIAASDGSRAEVVRELRQARVTSGPVGPMRFDRHGDPVPRHVDLYRMRDGAVLPEDR